MTELASALRDPDHGTKALELIRALVERVAIRPLEKEFEIELIGAIAHMIKLATGSDAFVREPFASAVKLVAGAGFEPATFRL